MKVKLNNIKTGILIAIIICGLVIIGFLGSYAYFIITSAGKNQEVAVQTGNMVLVFEDGTDSFQGSLDFGSSATKSFTIENTGTLDANAIIKWDNLTNTYLNGSLTYSLSYSESEDGEYTEIVTNKKVPRSRIPSTKTLSNSLEIPTGVKYFYRLTITLNNLKDVDQTADLNAILSTNFTIEERANTKVNTMMVRSGSSYTGEFWSQAANIKTIVFENKLEPKENKKYSYDVSDAKDGSVMSYLVVDTEDNTKYTLYIQGDGIISLKNCRWLFYNFTSLESIEGIEFLDTSNATTMYQMFFGCSKLTSLDLSNFDTSNVTSMRAMFDKCGSLTTLDISSFDTSNVTNMEKMFYYCSSLKFVDVSNFDTSNITTMNYMFAECNSLTSLDVSHFETNNVTDMQYAFYNCASLTSLDVSHFNTSKVTNMNNMFAKCGSLTALDVTNFDTSNVTNMGGLFFNCNNLQSIDVSSFDTSNVNYMRDVFRGCSSLTTLDITNFDTSNVTNMYAMFQDCTNLTSLDLSNLDTSNVTEMYAMFSGDTNLTTTIIIMGTKCTSYSNMFYNAATADDAKITVNYTSGAFGVASNMVATKSSGSHVVKGVLV